MYIERRLLSVKHYNIQVRRTAGWYTNTDVGDDKQWRNIWCQWEICKCRQWL